MKSQGLVKHRLQVWTGIGIKHTRTSDTTQIFFSAALFISLHGARSGEVRQLCVQSLVAYLLGLSWTKFKKGGRGVLNIEFI